MQLLERYGVVTREAVLAEGVVGGYASVYGVLKVLEERGQTRRGYFVTGLGAAQFSLPGAVDRLRSVREAADLELHPEDVPAPLVLAATDPAQPYGAAIAWPDNAGRPARSAGALVVLRDGVPLVWFDRRGHHLVTFPAASTDDSWAEALAALVKDGRARSVEVRKVNGDAGGPEVSPRRRCSAAAGSPRATGGSCCAPDRVADRAQAGPREVGHLLREHVRVERAVELDDPRRLPRPTRQPVGERALLVGVDVGGGDQRRDRLRGLVGDPADRRGALRVAVRLRAEQQEERIVIVGDPPEVRPETAARSGPCRRGRLRWPW